MVTLFLLEEMTKIPPCSIGFFTWNSEIIIGLFDCFNCYEFGMCQIDFTAIQWLNFHIDVSNSLSHYKVSIQRVNFNVLIQNFLLMFQLKCTLLMMFQFNVRYVSEIYYLLFAYFVLNVLVYSIICVKKFVSICCSS